MSDEQRPNKPEEPRMDAAAADDADAAESALEDEENSQAMRALLKRAMPTVDADDVPADYILKGVQKKLRQRSKGKFFGDGWSTSQTRMSYGLVALTMLILLCLAFFAISPGTVMP